MPSSGVSTFSVTCQQLITDAFILAEIIDDTDVLEAADYNVALNALNKMVKSLQARGYGLWLNQEVFLALGYQQQSFLLGPTGDNCSASMNQAAIATSGNAGDTSITLVSAAGISNGDYIGIQLDDGTMQWTTVSGIPANNIVPLAAALTYSASIPNIVFSYTTKINRPLEIIEARLRDKNGLDSPMDIINVYDYRQSLSQKATQGKPNQVAYDPQLTNGVLYVWETASDVTDRLVMTAKRPVYDFVNVGDEPDFPIEWSEFLEAALARRLSFKFPTSPEKKKELIMLEKELQIDVESFDRERYIQFMPDYD